MGRDVGRGPSKLVLKRLPQCGSTQPDLLGIALLAVVVDAIDSLVAILHDRDEARMGNASIPLLGVFAKAHSLSAAIQLQEKLGEPWWRLIFFISPGRASSAKLRAPSAEH
jgi:hypothetical protein